MVATPPGPVTPTGGVTPPNFANGGVTPPYFANGEEYLRLLREAQKESNNGSISWTSSRRDSPRDSPKSPPNSPNTGEADGRYASYERYYVNYMDKVTTSLLSLTTASKLLDQTSRMTRK